MKEEIKSISGSVNDVKDIAVGTLKQRLSNPFVGSFIITFAALNWRPVVYFLFSRKDIEAKFEFITKNYYDDQWNGWLSWFMYLFFPMLISLFYLAILPWVTDRIDKFVQKTILNKSRRDHIINYRKRKNLADLAWADYKAEEARTGFEDRRNLNNELEKLKDSLKKENEQVVTLTSTNQSLQEQLNTTNTTLKEKNLENEALKNDLKVTSNALNERQKFIGDQAQEISKKDASIEEFKSNIKGLDQTIVDLKTINRDLVLSEGELKTKSEVLENELKRILKEIEKEKANKDELQSILLRNENEKDKLLEEKSELEKRTVQLNFDLDILRNRLSQYEEFEGNIEYLKSYYYTILDNVPNISNPDFNSSDSLQEFLRKSNIFINNIKEYLLQNKAAQENTLLRIYRTNNQPKTSILNHIFEIAKDLNIRIFNVKFLDNGIVDISIYISDGIIIQRFIERGLGVWDTEKWDQYAV